MTGSTGRAGSAPRASAYRTLAAELRSAVLDRAFDESRLPTESELARDHGLSRQTVRRAFQELVAEGLVYRVPGRGTFPTPSAPRYRRRFDTVDDLMALSVDTLLELTVPLHRGVDVDAAAALGLSGDTVALVGLRRWYEGVAFCSTTVALPPPVGSLLEREPRLTEAGRTSAATVIGMLDQRLHRPIAQVEQSTTAAAVPPAAAADLGLSAGAVVLRIERTYLDADGSPVELAISHFHPQHYTHRARPRRDLR